MARQVRRAATTIPGASLRGLVFDACYNNKIEHTFALLKHFGMPNRNRVLVSESDHLDTANLAVALRIDEQEIVSRRYPECGRGHRKFYGVHVLKTRIEDRVRRFSPAAIINGILHHPATHELRDIPFSTVGWDILQETCPCIDKGVRQGWITTNGSSRCHSCGGDLGKIDAIVVSDELRASLKLIAGIVDPDLDARLESTAMLPSALRSTDLTLLYDMIMNITRVYTGDRSTSELELATTRTAAMARACDAVLEWPRGLPVNGRIDDTVPHIQDWIRRNYPMLDLCNQDSEGETNIPGDVCSTAKVHSGIRYALSGSVGRITSSMVSGLTAARIANIDVQALREAWDNGRLTQHVWVQKGIRVPAYDPAEVARLAPELRVDIARRQAGSFLGMPLYGVEQLIALEILAPKAPKPGFNQSGTHIQAAKQLVERVEATASSVKDPISFVDAIRHVSGRMKPWGAAFAAMLDGTIEFAIERKHSKPLVGRVVVSTAAIPLITALSETSKPPVSVHYADVWSQADALECLNANPKSPPAPLAGIASTGQNPKLYRVTEVLERAALGVTTADLGRRSGLGVMRVLKLLDEQSVPLIASGLWERIAAEELIMNRLVELQRMHDPSDQDR